MQTWNFITVGNALPATAPIASDLFAPIPVHQSQEVVMFDVSVSCHVTPVVEDCHPIRSNNCMTPSDSFRPDPFQPPQN